MENGSDKLSAGRGRIGRGTSALVVIDAQERLVSAMSAPDAAVARIALLCEAAERLGVPVLASEQYPRGLGRTVAGLADHVARGVVLEKTEFSVLDADGAAEWLEAQGRPQLVLTGFEAHVCVLQTAIAFAEQGYSVHVVEDAVSSRRSSDHAAAMHRLRANGIGVATSEMVVFEWLERAGTPEFKEVSRLVK